MSAPFLLRQLAGKPMSPPSLAESALILIDAQNTYRSGTMELTGIEPALDACARLLARARRLGVPVIHVQHDSGPGSLFDIRAGIGAIADTVAPVDGEPVVVKRLPNAFVGTELEAVLKEKGVKNLVIAGFMTHNCVNSTARGAYSLGYGVTVPADCTATRSLPALGGGVVSAEALQASVLATLADVFAIVVATGEAIPD